MCKKYRTIFFHPSTVTTQLDTFSHQMSYMANHNTIAIKKSSNIKYSGLERVYLRYQSVHMGLYQLTVKSVQHGFYAIIGFPGMLCQVRKKTSNLVNC